MNIRSILKLPLFARLASSTGSAEVKDYTNETEALWRAQKFQSTPAQRIDRAKVFLGFLNENPEVDAVNALRLATSEGKTSKLSSEELVENAKEYLGFLAA